MLVQIRRVSTRSVFLLASTLYGIVGLLVGVILAVVARLDVPPGTEANLLSRLGLWSIAAFPILYGLIGGLTAAVAAALYNATAAVVGGVRVEVPDVQPAWPDRDTRPGEKEEDGE